MKRCFGTQLGLLFALVAFSSSAWGASSLSRTAKPGPRYSEATVARLVRVQHARELLGKQYRKSAVRHGEKVREVNSRVVAWTRNHLPAKWKKDAAKISRAIVKAANQHSFDPFFLMAVIENESSFNPAARGTSGEIGLMQIMPSTGKWLAEKLNIRWKSEMATLGDPVRNIQLGAAYLAMLRERFDSRSRLYLAAYNMGSLNVRRNLERNVLPKEYASRVMKRYVHYYVLLRAQEKKNS